MQATRRPRAGTLGANPPDAVQPDTQGTLRLQPQGSYPHSISRRCVVEIAAPLGLPLPAGDPVAIAALTDLLHSTLAVAHLRLAPTSSASSSVTDRFSLGGLPAGLAQPAGDHHPVPLAERVGQMLSLPPPDINLEEAGVAVAPLPVLLDAVGG